MQLRDRRHERSWWLVAMLVVAVLTGCSSEVAELPATQAAAPSSVSKKSAATPAVKKVAQNGTLKKGAKQSGAKAADKNSPATGNEATGEEAEDSTPAVVFEPPYKNRFDLFVPPGKPKIVRVKKSDTGDDLSLAGFANIRGKPKRAIFVINGEQKLLGVGQSYLGFEVVDINEPEVTLKRGRQGRWTVTIAAIDESEEE